ncbi:helix-turn-helix domain-containing protein [Candidatus Villigracilis affinis]|uniref:winged helix-turn-helix domain-containing protein n=1 Tax=Candidatus Villigracilis affinis TaxID=3140682 RepID=UPI002A1CD95B|nr:winged helix-turn-helix domain-containing protein [Anaerolineales bacterium]
MLYLLAGYPKQVFTRDQLLERVWGHADYIDPGTVTVHVRRLREKLNATRPHQNISLPSGAWDINLNYENLVDRTPLIARFVLGILLITALSLGVFKVLMAPHYAN